jgi:ParB/RepB/Spo0J family partition protein
MQPILKFLPLTSIRPSTTNPRTRFDPKKITSLAESIKANGVMQPILVRPLPDHHEHSHEIVAGHRRFMAANEAGLDEIPANCRMLSDDECIEMQAIENAQREGLSPIEEAQAYASLMNRLCYTPEIIAAKVGKGRTSIYNTLKLLTLCDEGKELVNTGELQRSIAEMISQISSPSDQKIAIDKVLRGDEHSPGAMSYRDAKRYLKNRFSNDLDSAIFLLDQTYGDLQPCNVCPKNTTCNEELRKEHDGDESVCTDSSCWEVKSERKREEVATGLRNEGFEVFVTFKCPSKYMVLSDIVKGFGYQTMANLLPKKVKLEVTAKWVDQYANVKDIMLKKEAIELLAKHGVKPQETHRSNPTSNAKHDPNAPNFENTGRYINAMRIRCAKEVISKTPEVLAGPSGHLVLPTIIKAIVVGSFKCDSYDQEDWPALLIKDEIIAQPSLMGPLSNDEIAIAVERALLKRGLNSGAEVLVEMALHSGNFLSDDAAWESEQPHLEMLAELFEVPLEITAADRIVAESEAA